MNLVYIAGPYRAITTYSTILNIRRAEDTAIKVWQHGDAALCPHKNSALFDGLAEDELWLEGGLLMLSKCDAMIMIDFWWRSKGTLAEAAYALEHGIPIYQGADDYFARRELDPCAIRRHIEMENTLTCSAQEASQSSSPQTRT